MSQATGPLTKPGPRKHDDNRLQHRAEKEHGDCVGGCHRVSGTLLLQAFAPGDPRDFDILRPSHIMAIDEDRL